MGAVMIDRQDLAGIKVPTLILHGVRGDSAPAATTGRLAFLARDRSIG